MSWTYPKDASDHPVERNQCIAGTPLASMVWQRQLHRVRLAFRPNTDLGEEQLFLVHLKNTIEARITENARVLLAEIDAGKRTIPGLEPIKETT